MFKKIYQLRNFNIISVVYFKLQIMNFEHKIIHYKGVHSTAIKRLNVQQSAPLAASQMPITSKFCFGLEYILIFLQSYRD